MLMFLLHSPKVSVAIQTEPVEFSVNSSQADMILFASVLSDSIQQFGNTFAQSLPTLAAAAVRQHKDYDYQLQYQPPQKAKDVEWLFAPEMWDFPISPDDYQLIMTYIRLVSSKADRSQSSKPNIQQKANDLSESFIAVLVIRVFTNGLWVVHHVCETGKFEKFDTLMRSVKLSKLPKHLKELAYKHV